MKAESLETIENATNEYKQLLVEGLKQTSIKDLLLKIRSIRNF